MLDEEIKDNRENQRKLRRYASERLSCKKAANNYRKELHCMDEELKRIEIEIEESNELNSSISE